MIGVDIGTKAIKIVELEKKGSGWVLMGSGLVGFESVGLDQLEDEVGLIKLAQVVKKLYRDARISSRDVGISLPEAAVFTRSVKFPLLSEQEIASAIKWEAEQYIPIPVSEAEVSFKVVDRNEKLTTEGVTVLLIAAPTKMVEKYVKVATLAGLNPVFVETELVSLARSLGVEGRSAVVVDFGSRSTDVAIVKDQNLLFSRSVPTAGEAFTRAVAQGLGIETLQAEEYKKTYGLTEGQLEGKIRAILDPVLKVITDEVKKAISYYQVESKGETPKTMIISGGSSILPNLVALLSKQLGMEVIVGDPFTRVAVDESVKKNLAPFASLYAIAVGLAMREK